MAAKTDDEVKSTEYPKSLHAGGDRNATHRIVQDEDEERAARAEGFKMIDQKHDKAAAERLAVEVEKEEPEAPAPKVEKKGKK